MTDPVFKKMLESEDYGKVSSLLKNKQIEEFKFNNGRLNNNKNKSDSDSDEDSDNENKKIKNQ